MLALRALSLLMLVDLSGLTHTAFDLACVLGGGEHMDADCDDESGHECPPGCIDCHDFHAGCTITTPPAITFALEPLRRERPVALPPPPYTRSEPLAPDQSTLYRPPRLQAST
ncbi:MAG: hypothetical protein ABW352_24030 [Polyangiales bacterium]